MVRRKGKAGRETRKGKGIKGLKDILKKQKSALTHKLGLKKNR